MENNNLADLAMAHRYLYYVLCEPVISDVRYDFLEKEALLTCSEDHPLRKTGSSLRSSYSVDIINAAEKLLAAASK